MAKVPVLNWKMERVGEVDLPAEVFEYPYRRHLVWEVVKAYGQLNSTRRRSPGFSNGRNTFKQKGTGHLAERKPSSDPPPANGRPGRAPRARASVGEKKNTLNRPVASGRAAPGVDKMDLEATGGEPSDRQARRVRQGALRRLARAECACGASELEDRRSAPRQRLRRDEPPLVLSPRVEQVVTHPDGRRRECADRSSAVPSSPKSTRSGAANTHCSKSPDANKIEIERRHGALRRQGRAGPWPTAAS